PRQRDRSPVRGNQTVRHPTRPRRRPSLPPQTCFVSSVSIVARQTRSATTVSSLRSSHQAANRVSNYRRLRPVLSAELPAELSAEVVFCFPEPPLLAGPAEPLPCFPPPEPAPLLNYRSHRPSQHHLSWSAANRTTWVPPKCVLHLRPSPRNHRDRSSSAPPVSNHRPVARTSADCAEPNWPAVCEPASGRVQASAPVPASGLVSGPARHASPLPRPSWLPPRGRSCGRSPAAAS